jgi:hypothetical protein
MTNVSTHPGGVGVVKGAGRGIGVAAVGVGGTPQSFARAGILCISSHTTQGENDAGKP